MSIEELAMSWIYELMNTMSITRTAYEHRNYNWVKSVEYSIELRAWREQYRKVSQLCHVIGGAVLGKFNEMFPNGIETYKDTK